MNKIINLLFLLVLAGNICRADLISVSNKVGQKISESERAKYGLFEKENNFSYAVFLQLKDGTYTLNIVYNDGSSKTRLLDDAEFFAFRKYIDEFNGKKPPLKNAFAINLKEGLLYTLLFTIGSSIMIGPSIADH
jgi:hypothetical protein